jgi:hypothetical protein
LMFKNKNTIVEVTDSFDFMSDQICH